MNSRFIDSTDRDCCVISDCLAGVNRFEKHNIGKNLKTFWQSRFSVQAKPIRSKSNLIS